MGHHRERVLSFSILTGFTPGLHLRIRLQRQNKTVKRTSASSQASRSAAFFTRPHLRRICYVPMRFEGKRAPEVKSKTSAKASEKQTRGSWRPQARVPGQKDVCRQAPGVDFWSVACFYAWKVGFTLSYTWRYNNLHKREAATSFPRTSVKLESQVDKMSKW